MSSQIREDAVSKVEQHHDDALQRRPPDGIAEEKERFARLKDDLRPMTRAARLRAASLMDRTEKIGDLAKNTSLMSRQVQDAVVKATTDKDKKQNMLELYKQGRFDKALHWLASIGADEALHRLRNMSPEHKVALFNVERANIAKTAAKHLEAKSRLDAEINQLRDSSSATIKQLTQELDEEKRRREVAERREKIADQGWRDAAAQRRQAANEAMVRQQTAEEKAEKQVQEAGKRQRAAEDQQRKAEQEAKKQQKEAEKRQEKADQELQKADQQRQAAEKRQHAAEEQQRKADEEAKKQQQKVNQKLQTAEERQQKADKQRQTAEKQQQAAESESLKLQGQLKSLSEEVDLLRQKSTKRITDLLQKIAELEQKNTELKQAKKEASLKNTDLAQKDAELKEARNDLARKDTELKQAKKEASLKNTDLAQKDTELKKARNDLAQKDIELELAKDEASLRDADIARKNADIAKAKGEISRRDADLAEKKDDIEKARVEISRRDADLAHIKAASEQTRRNIALFLMGERYKEQNPDSWTPFADCLQLAAAPGLPLVEQHRWWTAAPSWRQQITPSIHQRPTGVEAIVVLYGESIAGRWTYHGCVSLQVVTRYLEATEAAPIGMVMETLDRWLAIMAQDDVDIDAISEFVFGTSQVIGLIRLRWPETEGLADIEGRCQQMLDQSPADLRLIRDLVSGAECGDHIQAIFMNDNQRGTPMLTDTPHMYCPAQETLLIAPVTPSSPVWALDLRHHEIWLVDKIRSDFIDIDNFRVSRLDGEDLMVSLTAEDVDFIFDYMEL
ncbi:hypothetical protein F5Y14DRAFT_424791 [Nemania sp. NC0429]|nr:hypothetical protein F5Y14DRAFT_424791 [Nemania sp. NC0429]